MKAQTQRNDKSSIVLELQRDALDRNTEVADLLRNALVVARKLDVTDIQAWIEYELGGYPEGAEIPDYRLIRGNVHGWNPYHGWIPVTFESSEDAEFYSTQQCGIAIPEIEHVLKKEGMPQSQLPPKVGVELMKHLAVDRPPIVMFSQSNFVRILNKVRDTILTWALKLESAGICGEGLSFTAEEKQQANACSYNINNFFGPVGASSIQQDVGHATQVFVSAEVDLSRVREFLEELWDKLADFNLPPQQEADLRAEAQTIETQVESSEPKLAIIRGALHSIQTILEGAAGTTAATLFAKFFGL